MSSCKCIIQVLALRNAFAGVFNLILIMKWRRSMNEQTNESVVKIKIVGVGGGGKNAVERMLETNIPMVNNVI